ncbi:MAG: penicillin-binding protein 2 [Lachnospira sp.]|nr:penicillin-binding protein 2 [Lachnospira sp.]
MAENSDNRAKRNKYRRKKAMLKRAHKKAGIAFCVIAVMLLVLAGRIAMINYSHGDTYSKAVLDHQSYTSTTIPNKRGEILTSNGTILAYSERVYNLIFDPKLVLSDSDYKEPTINALVTCFGLERSNLEEILRTKPDSHYEKLLKELTSDEIAEFKALVQDTKNNPNIKGVWFEESYIRKYPFSTLACDVVGFASAANGGELGLESYYDDELSGTDGVSYSYVDENLDVQQTNKDAVDGNNIITTIDYNVQSIIERKIAEYNEERPSNATAVLVMNPNNGEVLGMASYPFFDLNNPRSLEGIYSEEELSGMTDEQKSNTMYSLWRNYCISQTYEPGSTFKPFTVASGLEEGVTHDGDTFYCAGFEAIGGYTIRCHVYNKTGSHGEISLEQGLMQSCNPTMMQIAARLGGVKFAQYQRLFGFGSKTGIDLPAEENGITKKSDMSETDVATNAFGQNINVTMIQMGAAFCSLINGGDYYQPHIVKRIEKASGEVVKNFEPTLVRQTVTSSTSKLLRQYLRSTVDEGLAKKASVTGYSIGGKTGTAQKGNRNDLKWVVSFIGCAPAENPQVMIYVLLDEPYETTGTSGSTVDNLLLAHDIFEELLPYMNIFKDVQAEPVDTTDSEVEGMVDIDIPNNNSGE